MRYSKWTTTNFAVTNDRVIFRQGMVAKSGVEIPLERIMNVNFKQSIWERMIGAGDLLIESGGKDGQSRSATSEARARREGDPQAGEPVRGEARSTGSRGGCGCGRRSEREPAAAAPARGAETGAGGTGAPAPADATEQLEKLHDLLTKGAITQAEYDSKKAELLNRL